MEYFRIKAPFPVLDSRNTLNTVPTLEPCKDFRFFPRIDLIRYPLAFWAGEGGLMFAPLPLKKLNDRSYRDGYASIKLFVDRTIPFFSFFSSLSEDNLDPRKDPRRGWEIWLIEKYVILKFKYFSSVFKNSILFFSCDDVDLLIFNP